MSIGKMNTFIEIISTEPVKDSEGFVKTGDNILASLRAYKEDQHGSEAWKNRATFSSATSLFRFRSIPNMKVLTSHTIVCPDGRYNIVSVEDIKRKGMYIEVLAERIT